MTKTIRINPRLTAPEFGIKPILFDTFVKDKDLPVVAKTKDFYTVLVADEEYTVHESDLVGYVVPVETE